MYAAACADLRIGDLGGEFGLDMTAGCAIPVVERRAVNLFFRRSVFAETGI